MKKIKNFTLIELLVKRSHLCCNHVEGNDDETSPVPGQVNKSFRSHKYDCRKEMIFFPEVQSV